MWVYPVDGSTMALGPAVVTPLMLDLAMVVDTFNGHLDRDNLGVDATSSSSTIESPFANAVGYIQAAASAFVFSLANDGRRYITDVDQTITTKDALLVLTGMTSVQLSELTNPAPGETMKVQAAWGMEVDGRVVYHSGYVRVKVMGNSFKVHIPWARTEVGVPVGAGSHRLRLFYDFIVGPPSVVAMNIPLTSCKQLETFFAYDEVRF